MTDPDNQSGQFPPGGTPAFSMRTLMVVTPENALDSAFHHRPMQTADTNQTCSQSTDSARRAASTVKLINSGGSGGMRLGKLSAGCLDASRKLRD